MRMWLHPGFLFAQLGALVFVFGLLFTSIFNFNIHDTYFIIPRWYFFTLLAVIFWLIGLLHFGLEKWKRPLNKKMAYAHFLTTLSMILGIATVITTMKGSSYENMSEEMDYYGRVNMRISFFVLIGMLGQLIFIVNILLSLLRKRKPGL